MSRVAIYLRVSSERQGKEERTSFPVQEEACRRLAERENLGEVVYVFKDDVTGTNGDRPGWLQMVDVCRKLDVEHVVVYDHQRWGRNVREGFRVYDELEELGIGIHSTQYDMEHFEQRGFNFTMGESFSRTLSRRVREANWKLARDGYWPGNGKTQNPDGYIRIPGNKVLQIDEETKIGPRAAFELSAESKGASEVAAILRGRGLKTREGNPVIRTTVVGWVTNPFYKGVIRWNDPALRDSEIGHLDMAASKSKTNKARRKAAAQEYQGKHEALVSVELWNAANATLDSRKNRRQRHDNPMLAAGLVRCGLCGGPAQYTTGWKGFGYYRCSRSNSQTKQRTTWKTCDAKWQVRAEAVDRYFRGFIEYLAPEEATLTELAMWLGSAEGQLNAEHEAEKARLEKQVNFHEGRLRTIQDMLVDGKLAPAAFEDMRSRYEADLNDAREARLNLPPKADLGDVQEAVAALRRIGDEMAGDKALRSNVRAIFAGIDVFPADTRTKKRVVYDVKRGVAAWARNEYGVEAFVDEYMREQGVRVQIVPRAEGLLTLTEGGRLRTSTDSYPLLAQWAGRWAPNQLEPEERPAPYS